MNLKYRNEAVVVLSFQIAKDYSVWAMANKPKDADGYIVKLYLKAKSVGMLNEIEDGKTTIASDQKEIRAKIAEYVTDLNNQNFFAHYIARNDFELKCFDKGNEYYEEQRHVVE